MWTLYDPRFECDADMEHEHTPWGGHRRFVYDYIRNTRPTVVVELGTATGTSFFAMCQAVKDANLLTYVRSVDNWEGDVNAGYYGPEVKEGVKATIARYYPYVATILTKGLFHNTVQEHPDGSIDILHIDGCHSYEAVREDFTDWLPKVRPGGLVMLHDTMMDMPSFGTMEFFAEIERTPGLYTQKFHHSCGLGLVSTDPSRLPTPPLVAYYEAFYPAYDSPLDLQLWDLSQYKLWGDDNEVDAGHSAGV